MLSKGAAWGALLTSSDYASLLPDADAVYQQNKLSVQNHSYGTGIENFYGTDAVAYDMTVKNTPVLLHVFSAGNSGTLASASGPYSAIQGFANLTGSFKMAAAKVYRASPRIRVFGDIVFADRPALTYPNPAR